MFFEQQNNTICFLFKFDSCRVFDDDFSLIRNKSVPGTMKNCTLYWPQVTDVYASQKKKKKKKKKATMII